MSPFELVPLRWPAGWSAERTRLIPADSANCIVAEKPPSDLDASRFTVVALKDAPAILMKGAKAPRVRGGPGEGDSTGPTGTPWVDSNGYLIQVTRALRPDKPVWLDYAPNRNDTRPEVLQLCVADASAYGADWLIRPEAANGTAWVEAVRFFAAHKAWRKWTPVAKLAVQIKEPNALSLETLNLLTRRNVPYAINPPDPAPYADVLALDGATTKNPYELAVSTHLKMSRRNDVLRLWNAGTFNAYYTADPAGSTHLVQLLNYSARVPSSEVTLGLALTYRTARLHTIGAAPRDLEVLPVRAGVELRLPPIAVYGAIELGL